MPKTRAELIQQVLDIVNEAGAGQPESPEDAALVNGVIDPVLAMLNTLGVICIADPDAVDDDAFLPLATFLTSAIPALIRPDPLEIAAARSTLSELRADSVTNTVRVDYF